MNTQIMERQETPVAVVSESATILQVIQRAAADPQCDIEKMERLMAMHERMQSRNAETEFNAAMARMQTEMPSIAERGEIKVNNQVRSRYATFEDINDVVKPIMQAHGFAISFRVDHEPQQIKITGVLMHQAGHREQTAMVLPLDTSGSKNSVQAVGSSVSYGKRYVMSALLNITTRGEDDDGYAAVPAATVSETQAGQLSSLLRQCNEKTREGFIGMYGEPSEVAKTEFDLALARLTKAVARDNREKQDGNSA